VYLHIKYRKKKRKNGFADDEILNGNTTTTKMQLKQSLISGKVVVNHSYHQIPKKPHGKPKPHSKSNTDAD
jgi:hypothetical protein